MINSNPAISLKFRGELTDVEGARRDTPEKGVGDPFDPKLIHAEKATALTASHLNSESW
jgi:hypothetical protein